MRLISRENSLSGNQKYCSISISYLVAALGRLRRTCLGQPNFPDLQGKYREFHRNRANRVGFTLASTRDLRWNSLRLEQGIFYCEQGKILR